jgi:chemotaxis-related protein WspD
MTVELPRIDDCWNTIGVRGDRTCPRLVEAVHCRNCPVYADAGRTLFDRPPPDGYAAEWAERLAAPEPEPPGEAHPVLLFRVGEEWFALDVRVAVEVAPHRPVRRVPHQTDRVLAGLVNIRGELQLAVSLPHLFGTADAPADSGAAPPVVAEAARMLVVEQAGARWVLVVDAVEDLYYVPARDLAGLPSTVAVGKRVFTRSAFAWRGHTVGYLDADRLFAALRRTFR